jgi:hypothetical protein
MKGMKIKKKMEMKRMGIKKKKEMKMGGINKKMEMKMVKFILNKIIFFVNFLKTQKNMHFLYFHLFLLSFRIFL